MADISQNTKNVLTILGVLPAAASLDKKGAEINLDALNLPGYQGKAFYMLDTGGEPVIKFESPETAKQFQVDLQTSHIDQPEYWLECASTGAALQDHYASKGGVVPQTGKPAISKEAYLTAVEALSNLSKDEPVIAPEDDDKFSFRLNPEILTYTALLKDQTPDFTVTEDEHKKFVADAKVERHLDDTQAKNLDEIMGDLKKVMGQGNQLAQQFRPFAPGVSNAISQAVGLIGTAVTIYETAQLVGHMWEEFKGWQQDRAEKKTVQEVRALADEARAHPEKLDKITKDFGKAHERAEKRGLSDIFSKTTDTLENRGHEGMKAILGRQAEMKAEQEAQKPQANKTEAPVPEVPTTVVEVPAKNSPPTLEQELDALREELNRPPTFGERIGGLRQGIGRAMNNVLGGGKSENSDVSPMTLEELEARLAPHVPSSATVTQATSQPDPIDRMIEQLDSERHYTSPEQAIIGEIIHGSALHAAKEAKINGETALEQLLEGFDNRLRDQFSTLATTRPDLSLTADDIRLPLQSALHVLEGRGMNDLLHSVPDRFLNAVLDNFPTHEQAVETPAESTAQTVTINTTQAMPVMSTPEAVPVAETPQTLGDIIRAATPESGLEVINVGGNSQTRGFSVSLDEKEYFVGIPTLGKGDDDLRVYEKRGTDRQGHDKLFRIDDDKKTPGAMDTAARVIETCMAQHGMGTQVESPETSAISNAPEISVTIPGPDPHAKDPKVLEAIESAFMNMNAPFGMNPNIAATGIALALTGVDDPGRYLDDCLSAMDKHCGGNPQLYEQAFDAVGTIFGNLGAVQEEAQALAAVGQEAARIG